MLALAVVPLVTFAQNTATGVVVDDKDTPIPGVTVQVKGTTVGTITDLDGKYSIKVAENGILVFSFVGCETKEVVAGSGQTVFNVKLGAKDQAINEVVVVGYGTVKKSDLTGAVASVKSEQLKQTSTMNVAEALAGRAAGVSVTASSGDPGSSMKVRIRGVGSLSNSDPLYVVDGFPTGNLSNISPSDIESMEILKDASSSAIYGSRGANGVVLITTKRGKAEKVGQTHVTVSSFLGSQTPWKKLQVCDAQQYATLVKESYTNSNATMDAFTQKSIDYVLAHPEFKGTDWQSEIFKASSIVQNYNINMNGGTERSTYNLSATYSSDQGLIKNSALNKYIISFNNDYQFSDKIKGSVSISYVNSEKQLYNNDMYSGSLPVAVRNSPLTSVLNSNTGTWGYDEWAHEQNSAMTTDFNQFNKWYENRVVGNLGLSVGLTKELSFKSQFGLEVNNSKGHKFSPVYFISNEYFNSNSNLSEDRNGYTDWTWSNYMQYQTKFAGAHDLTVMLGTEAHRAIWDNINASGKDVPQNSSLQYLSASNTLATTSIVSSWNDDQRLLSFFGRVNYGFQNKYLFTFMARRDGTSKFAEEARWGIFPSASFAWNIKNESFLKDVSAIYALKLRAGWGRVGNQNAAESNSTIVTVGSGKDYVFGTSQTQAIGVMSDRLGNPKLKWESTDTKNVGIDGSFLNGKIDLTADYFIKRTYDMITQVPIPNYVGSGSPYVNAASLENKGVEVSLTHRNEIGGLKYELGCNMSVIRTSVVDLGGGSPIFGGSAGHLGNTTKTEVGSEVGYFYGYKTDGIFHSDAEVQAYKDAKGNVIQSGAKPGDVKFVDVNGDGAITADDRTKIGSPNPKFAYGFNIGLSYMNFDFKMFLQGVQGNQIVNALDRYLASTSSPGGIMENMLVSRYNDRWSAANPNNNGARVARSDDNQNYQRFSDLYVEDGSYLKIKNIQIGYNIPSAILKKAKINSLRLYVSADNPFTFTKYTGMEPEVAGGTFDSNVDRATYPHPRILIGGFSINF